MKRRLLYFVLLAIGMVTVFQFVYIGNRGSIVALASESRMAAAADADPLANKNLNWDGVVRVLYGSVRWFFSVMEAIFVIFLVWSALSFMYAQGEPEKVETA